MSIVNNCMLVNVQLGAWTGVRLDRKTSRKVTEDANAAEGAARVDKYLVPKDKLLPVQSAQGKIRLHLYDRTLPWGDNGDRVLTRVMYMRFLEEHGALKSEFIAALDRFLTEDYPSVVDQASFRMGELFDPQDYPSPRDLRNKFYVNLDIGAIAEARDFRVKLAKGEIDRVRNDIEATINTRIVTAQKMVWTRLAETLGHFVDRMTQDVTFKDATVENLVELIDLLPGMNVTDDENLAAIIEQLKDQLSGVDAKVLRKDEKARKVLGREAKKIMKDVGGFMKAFGVKP